MEETNPRRNLHYHGDLVRKLFLFAAAVMVIGLPLVREEFSMPLWLSLLAVLGLGVFAGLTNPKHTWVMVLDTLTSMAALLIFEYFAVISFRAKQDLFFVLNQMLALVFLLALYYSTKSLRGKLNR